MTGIVNECLKAVEIKVKEMKQKCKKLICNLVLDEICIREDVYFNDIRLQDYVNFGQGSNNSDGLPKAKEALVFLVVPLNSNW